MSLLKNFVYLVGGAATGMVCAYLLSQREEAQQNHRYVAVVEKQPVEKTMERNPQRERDDAPKSGVEQDTPKQSAQETARQPESQEPKSEQNNEPLGSKSATFDRYPGWSRWNANTTAFQVYKAKSVEDCEAQCEKNEECHSATFLAGTCGLFHKHNEDDAPLAGEVNLNAVTSVRFEGDREGKTCHGPVRMIEGKPYERPGSAPCHASQEAAVNAVLQNAKPLKIFAPMMFGPKRDPF